ncbi:glutamyl-tRNA reductase [Brachybacterium saurashtrense]|uniref:Glutamyl-tRNA reductase n=1 Tax=Brachybacterium saurashtrense TaxID=556288 RepID=A0A345YQ87_9MICO|nr:glutamyl-tRNA reductase [Brachybacterium saurashtrense]AXK46089.1 glutamyl-tRNA reductase [Brachybacterium saurashtrense]RRR23829.1 glutamyl-tRNA reductase [Brachybacterium saurashtrense]
MLAALRASHEHLDLEVLDALTRGADSLPAAIAELQAERAGTAPVVAGEVVVSTCNRLEVYLDTDRFHEGVDLVVDAVARTSGLDREVVSLCFDAAMDAPVPQHLYEVTSGLRSLVLGEAEIAGQVRQAYEAARRDGRTTSMLHDLFQHGFRCAKSVATQAPVGAAGRSGATVAIDRAEVELGGFAGRRVLIVGTGAYARLGLAELVRRGVQDVQVFSPSGRAAGFAQRHGIATVEPAALEGALAGADLVLACSGRGTSLFPEQFLGAGRTVVLDLALHSDLHPLVRHLKGVTVVGLEDLRLGADAPADPALATARGIVAENVEAFRLQQEVRRIDPAMAALRREVFDAADGEIDRLRRDVSGETADQLERSVRRILAKVMHQPAERARHLAETGYADAYVEAFHTIFGIDISADQEYAAGAAGTAGAEGSAGVETEPVPAGWMRVDRTVPPRAQELVGAGASRAAGAAAGAGAAAAAGRAGGGPGAEGRLTASDIARVALRGGGCPVGGDRGDALPER